MGILYGGGGGGVGVVALPKHLTSNHAKNKEGSMLKRKRGGVLLVFARVYLNCQYLLFKLLCPKRGYS